jgi:hypothetical protein
MEDMFSKMQELLADPESMKQLSELAEMLRSETDAAPSSEDAAEPVQGGGFDPMLLMKLGEVWQNSQQQDDNTALLLALRPHLRAQRREKVDRAVRLLRLVTVWKALKESGMLQNFL